MRKNQAITFKNKIIVAETACSGGKIEKEGRLGDYLDLYFPSDDLEVGTFEKGEAEMVRQTVATLLGKAKISESDVDLMLGGDLMNQCTSTGYGLADFDVPYLGLYGACSTFALGLLTAGCLIDSGHIDSAVVTASSHFCTAERQFRFPLEYGSIAGTVAQTTVTGCGAVYLKRAEPNENGVTLIGGEYGIVVDRGIKDAGNMGAAMATAAADTIMRYLADTGKNASEFDKIATGDLGREGLSIALEIMKEKQVSASGVFCDCGELIYDLENQDVGCGGSGCGCSAVVASGYFFDELKKGRLNTLALVGTGAMMSQQSLQQGLSIPAVGHLICFEGIGKENKK